MNANLSGGTLKFKVPHTAENAAIVAFRSGALGHLLPPGAKVADARVVPNEVASTESTILVDLRQRN
jgi:hypothetical protein